MFTKILEKKKSPAGTTGAFPSVFDFVLLDEIKCFNLNISSFTQGNSTDLARYIVIPCA